MTLDDYKTAIEINLNDVHFFSVGYSDQCSECSSDDSLGFSWNSCESCGSSLGGDRFSAHGVIDGETVHFSICSDCLQYHANGTLPDLPEFEPQDDDYMITDSGSLGSRYYCEAVGEFSDYDRLIQAIADDMTKNNLFPSVWYCNDHGNISPVKFYISDIGIAYAE